MKTIWNIRKSEANGLKGHTVNMKILLMPHLLLIAEKIMQSISCSDAEGTSDIKKIQCSICLQYLITPFII
jgi:hypothetical protein